MAFYLQEQPLAPPPLPPQNKLQTQLNFQKLQNALKSQQSFNRRKSQGNNNSIVERQAEKSTNHSKHNRKHSMADHSHRSYLQGYSKATKNVFESYLLDTSKMSIGTGANSRNHSKPHEQDPPEREPLNIFRRPVHSDKTQQIQSKIKDDQHFIDQIKAKLQNSNLQAKLSHYQIRQQYQQQPKDNPQKHSNIYQQSKSYLQRAHQKQKTQLCFNKSQVDKGHKERQASSDKDKEYEQEKRDKERQWEREQQKEKERQREIERQRQREQSQEREKEREREREKEREREREREKEKSKEREIQLQKDKEQMNLFHKKKIPVEQSNGLKLQEKLKAFMNQKVKVAEKQVEKGWKHPNTTSNRSQSDLQQSQLISKKSSAKLLDHFKQTNNYLAHFRKQKEAKDKLHSFCQSQSQKQLQQKKRMGDSKEVQPIPDVVYSHRPLSKDRPSFIEEHSFKAPPADSSFRGPDDKPSLRMPAPAGKSPAHVTFMQDEQFEFTVNSCLPSQKSHIKVASGQSGVQRSDFEFQFVIGRGGFGRVWKVLHLKSRKQFAMKEMAKAKIICKKSVKSVMNEKALLQGLNHRFLVNMLYSFQNKEHLYLVMDLLQGGDLRYHIGKRKRFDEITTRFMVACIVDGLDYLRQQRIIHRDIKPENLVMDSQGYVRITDLGIARVRRTENSADTSGTPGYMAPEVMCHQNHSYSVDYYALGVIAYEFMLGRRPYQGKTRQEIRDNVLQRQVQVQEVPTGWSPQAVDFINQLIQRKPKHRLGHGSIEELKRHPWLLDFPWPHLQMKTIVSPYLQDMGIFNIDDLPTNNHLDTKRDTLYYDALRQLRLPETQDQFKGYDSCNLTLTSQHLSSVSPQPREQPRDDHLPPHHLSFLERRQSNQEHSSSFYYNI